MWQDVYFSICHTCGKAFAFRYVTHVARSQGPTGHDIGHWPAGPTAIFSRRASRATSMHFLLARWATRQQIGPPVGLEDTGPTPLVALFAKPTQTTDSHQCIDGYLSPWGCSAWLCLALFLMTQLTAQSIMWLPYRNSLPSQLCGCLIRRLDSSALCIQQSPNIALVAAFRFQRVSVCKSQYTMHLRDCI